MSILFPDLVGNGYFCIVYPAQCRILAKFSYMKLLIIDDNAAVRATLKIVLGRDYEVTAVGDPKLIPALINGGRVDVVLLDMNFDNAKLDCSDGLFWLERIKGSDKAPAVVVITAFGDVDVAVKAMKLGAEDFVTKPNTENWMIRESSKHKTNVTTIFFALPGLHIINSIRLFAARNPRALIPRTPPLSEAADNPKRRTIAPA